MTEEKNINLKSTKEAALNHEQEQIYQFVSKLHFKKALFGVQELDVWKKIDQLNSLYSQALIAERARYDALLEQQRHEPPRGDA